MAQKGATVKSDSVVLFFILFPFVWFFVSAVSTSLGFPVFPFA